LNKLYNIIDAGFGAQFMLLLADTFSDTTCECSIIFTVLIDTKLDGLILSVAIDNVIDRLLTFHCL